MGLSDSPTSQKGAPHDQLIKANYQLESGSTGSEDRRERYQLESGSTGSEDRRERVPQDTHTHMYICTHVCTHAYAHTCMHTAEKHQFLFGLHVTYSIPT